MLLMVLMLSPGMLRPLAATRTTLPHPTRGPTTLTTERTPAATGPSAGTPTTPSSSPDTKTSPPLHFFGRSKILGSAEVQLLLLNIPSHPIFKKAILPFINSA